MPIFYPYPKQCINHYRDIYKKHKKSDAQGCRPTTQFNMETAANEMFTKVREKNDFKQGVLPTTATTYTDFNKRRQDDKHRGSVDVIAQEIYHTNKTDIQHLLEEKIAL